MHFILRASSFEQEGIFWQGLLREGSARAASGGSRGRGSLRGEEAGLFGQEARFMAGDALCRVRGTFKWRLGCFW